MDHITHSKTTIPQVDQPKSEPLASQPPQLQPNQPRQQSWFMLLALMGALLIGISIPLASLGIQKPEYQTIKTPESEQQESETTPQPESPEPASPAPEQAVSAPTASISIKPSNSTSSARYPMPVLSLVYMPTTADGSLDTTEIGSLPVSSKQALTDRIVAVTAESLTKLTEASRYHGYKNQSAQPSLGYSLLESKTYYEALPPGLSVPWSQTAKRPNYRQLLERENICEYVDNRGVKEVWIWGYHTATIEPAESNMSMGSNSKQLWNFSDYGDVSNSEKSNDLPTCNNTYIVYNLNYGRGVGEVLENHTHHIEAVMEYLQPQLWKTFVGGCGDQTVYRCGWTHYPPNAMRNCSGHDYEWYNKSAVQSDCSNWTPDGTGKVEPVSCETWSPECKDDSGVSFKVWWMQNIPGEKNTLLFDGKPLGNWWSAIGSFDSQNN